MEEDESERVAKMVTERQGAGAGWERKIEDGNIRGEGVSKGIRTGRDFDRGKVGALERETSRAEHNRKLSMSLQVDEEPFPLDPFSLYGFPDLLFPVTAHLHALGKEYLQGWEFIGNIDGQACAPWAKGLLFCQIYDRNNSTELILCDTCSDITNN